MTVKAESVLLILFISFISMGHKPSDTKYDALDLLRVNPFVTGPGNIFWNRSLCLSHDANEKSFLATFNISNSSATVTCSEMAGTRANLVALVLAAVCSDREMAESCLKEIVPTFSPVST